MLDTHPRPNPRAAIPRAPSPIAPGALARQAGLAHRVTIPDDAVIPSSGARRA